MLNYVADNLSGAWDIMRGRREGFARLDLSIEGFWRSFGAILLLIPFAVVALMSQHRLLEATDATLAADRASDGFGIEATAFTIDWVAFPLVFAALAGPLGLASRYVPFIVARNWAAVVVTAMVSIVHAGHVLGSLPPALTPFLLLVTLGVGLWFAYVIARTSLDVPFGLAIGVVVLDFLISLVIWSAADRLG